MNENVSEIFVKNCLTKQKTELKDILTIKVKGYKEKTVTEKELEHILSVIPYGLPYTVKRNGEIIEEMEN